MEFIQIGSLSQKIRMYFFLMIFDDLDNFPDFFSSCGGLSEDCCFGHWPTCSVLEYIATPLDSVVVKGMFQIHNTNMGVWVRTP